MNSRITWKVLCMPWSCAINASPTMPLSSRANLLRGSSTWWFGAPNASAKSEKIATIRPCGTKRPCWIDCSIRFTTIWRTFLWESSRKIWKVRSSFGTGSTPG
ncbi:hypothetical protein HDK64DRAFT_20936 [Phyllosticta capitalensis]